jgi:N-acetylneuraminic acid mutarotase
MYFLLLFILCSFNLHAAGLSFEDRIAGQKAIESVYWKHRLWPAENKNPKPGFEEAVSGDLILSKVDDALRKSGALEEMWKRPLLASQLQAEMDRIVKETKDPRMLQDLFDALGNNPERIAECLARPILADRLIRNWYAYDQRFHGELRSRVEKEISTANSLNLRSLSGEYHEMIWKRSDSVGGDVNVNGEEWNALIQKVSDVFQQVPKGPGLRLPINQISKLQENESEFYVTTILEKSDDAIKIGSMRWEKTSFRKWWSESKSKFQLKSIAKSYTYKLPENIRDGGSCNGEWSRTPSPPVTARLWHSAVWTGTEMIVWGGSWTSYLKDGFKYNPATDVWTPTTLVGAPAVRRMHSAVWTGSEMIIWGGEGCVDENQCFPSDLNDGGRYNPTNDSWLPISSSNAPPGTHFATSVWTGSQMIIWGGIDQNNTPWRYDPAQDLWSAGTTVDAPAGAAANVAVWTGSQMIIWGGSPFPTGKRYNPQTDNWTSMSTLNAPPSAAWPSGIWTGTEMIVWGGSANGVIQNSGGRYNPATDSWNQTNLNNAPIARYSHTAVWTGTKMIVWGGLSDATFPSVIFNDGGIYNPNNDSWTSVNLENAPSKRFVHTAVWSGNEMIIFGGLNGNNTGSRYNPSTDSWVATSTSGVPVGRWIHTAVWTGTEMIVWGGNNLNFDLNSGGTYNPGTNAWSILDDVELLEPRSRHTAVWTGTEMIVWGGSSEGLSQNDGARFNPLTMQWSVTSNTNAPETRYFHTAIWTGSKMIIWGGEFCLTQPTCPSDNALQTGGSYDPITDQWWPTSLTNVPAKRGQHSAIWTGTEMIIWGGDNVLNGLLNSGSRYNPFTDTWNDITSINAPETRKEQTSVWTGDKMIVWGGIDGNDELNTGGVYDPASDSWTNTTLINAPAERYGQRGIWTGDRMIVWGGWNSTTGSLDTGGEYDVLGDSWSPTSTVNPPPPAYFHTAVWTGTHMIVWGGWFQFTEGGLYCTNPSAVLVNPDSYTTEENQTLFVAAPGVLENDTDASGDPLSAVLVTSTSHGILTFNSDGSFQYVPDLDFSGTDSFEYYATDGNQNSYTTTVTLTINSSCLYCDDFEDGVLDSNWTYKRTWNEAAGSLNGDGTAKKAIAIASPVFNGCTNCTADFVVQSSGGSLSKVWMYSWYVDKKNSIELMMKEDKDKWILRDRFNGVVVSKFKASQQIIPNVIYNVRMSYDGNQIQVFVNDFQNAIITFVPAHTISPGTIGLKVVNTDVSLQSISVY